MSPSTQIREVTLPMCGSIVTTTSARLLATMTAAASQLSTMYPASAATRCQLTGVTYAPNRMQAQMTS